MTGGHVQGELLKTEDVVSLLIDDAQLEQKLREIPLQAKDRQKKKRPPKGIRVDAEGVVSLEDVDNPGSQDADYGPVEQHDGTASNKKRKSRSDNQTPPKPQNPPKSKNNAMIMELGERHPLGHNQVDAPQQRPKRPKKSVNESLESSHNSSEYYQQSSYDYSLHDYGGGA